MLVSIGQVTFQKKKRGLKGPEIARQELADMMCNIVTWRPSWLLDEITFSSPEYACPLMPLLKFLNCNCSIKPQFGVKMVPNNASDLYLPSCQI